MGCDGMTSLRDLRARGGFARDGGMLSRFSLELHGEQLHIYGRDACYINAARTKVLQREYHYCLEEAEAARLSECPRDRIHVYRRQNSPVKGRIRLQTRENLL